MAEGPTLASLDAGNETPHDTMRSLMAEMGGVTEPSAPEPVETHVETVPDAPETPADGGDGRARDERGRFTSKAADESAGGVKDKPVEGAEKAESTPEGGEEPVEAAADDDIDPPHDRPLEWQTEFRKLPPALKKFVLDADQTAKDVAAERGRYQALDQIMGPRRNQLAMQGYTDDVAAIKALFAYSDYVDQNPARFIQELMQAKGLQFDAGQPQQEQAEDYDDPVIKELRASNQQLAAELNAIKQGLQGQQQSAQQQMISQAQAELAAFRDAKDEKGRLTHPYMSEPRIRRMMSSMLRSGVAPDHVKAYDMACRADPEVSAKIAAAADAVRQRELDAERRKKAGAAQRAGSSVTGTPAGPTGLELSGKSGARDDLAAIAASMGFTR